MSPNFLLFKYKTRSLISSTLVFCSLVQFIFTSFFMPYHFDFFTRELRTFHSCRQHKDRASQNEQTVETLGSHLEETVRFSFVVQDFVSQLLTSPSFSPSPLPPSPSLLQTLELEQLRTKLTKSTRENFRHEAEIGTLSAYVNLLSPLSLCTSVQSAVLHQVQKFNNGWPQSKT